MIQAVITDIEGTTTSLSFVKDVLFPYARERMADFVRQRAEDPIVASLLREVQAAAPDKTLDQAGIIRQLLAWMDVDAKVTALKSLQGLLWEAGYRRGDFTGHIYPDVEPNLRAWRKLGISLYVFSSGSVQAQKLLFAHAPGCDLTSLFDGYFDTRIGSKREPNSYQRIADAIDVPSEDILFLSDTEEELDAAAAVGMNTIWLVRNEKLNPGASHPQVPNFNSIRV
ncbi:acireductone synthase [Nitrosococcus watsonii]|uniref:Enolase-phosphatase E1 n=1 Tax=Nitrosococcus watsoni (strain C-113) TaxID=105559 RepID=D8KBP1_NITWC|nr:acireductone synthase [Nitrosococcus watsonii]ADJ27652.1 2,3-diketo-5-methylthio-1-phosphopentane phosphatase [Nitrosococcus watsonii C-113]